MSKKKQTPREIHLIRKKLWDATMSNFDKYIDKNTKLIDKKFTEYRNCPACVSDQNRFLLLKNGGTYVECEKCNMIFINPVFKNNYLEKYYKTSHAVRSEISLSEIEFFNFTYGKGLKLASQYFDKTGNILEVGCSAGMFLDMAKKNNWKTYGLELNPAEAKEAKNKGHNIQEKTLENVNFDVKFDIIFFWDVFEHIKNGIDCLENCKKILKKNGIIFLQCPSRDSLALKILQEKCNMLDGIEHVNIYGHSSLSKLCERTKCKILNYETIISEIGIINNHLNFEDPYLGSTKNTENVFGIMNEELMHKNKMGYKFQACIKFI